MDTGTYSSISNRKAVETDSATVTISGTCTGNHTHKVTAKGTISGGAYTFSGTASNTGYNGDSEKTECRPDNYTVKLWKRTA